MPSSVENPRKIFVANWKAVGQMAQVLAPWVDYWVSHQELITNDIQIIVAPPFTHLEQMHNVLNERQIRIAVAAQDVSRYPAGNHTGGIPATLLKETGVTHVIIGHSETRESTNLTNDDVKAKVKQAEINGLLPIVCVSSVQEAWQSLERSFSGIIAYEPISAVGTGLPADPEKVGNVCDQIKSLFPNARILYGGSVTPDNVRNYINLPSVDGVLVGQKSHNPIFFSNVISAATSS